MIDPRKALENFPFKNLVRVNEPMSLHTSFQVGGAADLYLAPEATEDLAQVLEFATTNVVPVFILGAGANILVSDRGIRGLVIDMHNFNSSEVKGDVVVAGAGTPVSRVAEVAADAGLTGLEFIYSMPGSVGGSIWMNARCYGVAISDVLTFVDVVSPENGVVRWTPDTGEFGYKVSPFQSRSDVIVKAGFTLVQGKEEKIRGSMEYHRRDRERKGHFDAPSVGSVFKNNREFGAPTGSIIDSLGLRGFAMGGAKVSVPHANIIINTGEATASDILSLIREVESRVYQARGFKLEREVRLVGEWEEEYER